MWSFRLSACVYIYIYVRQMYICVYIFFQLQKTYNSGFIIM